jgi:tetratricopeptide (TPR) repeat protein
MFLGRAGLAGSCRVPDQAYLDLLARWLARPVHASRSGLLIYRGYYLDRAGRIDEALATLEEAYRVGGRQSQVALVIAAELAIDAGRLEEAERLLERAREANRRSRRDSSSDIDRAASRLVIARERPGELQRFDPFKE